MSEALTLKETTARWFETMCEHVEVSGCECFRAKDGRVAGILLTFYVNGQRLQAGLKANGDEIIIEKIC